ncbi:MAG: alginate export family protein [Rickettsiales bacterium]|nr:alginate export family protein [Rickettsiales bacterium]
MPKHILSVILLLGALTLPIAAAAEALHEHVTDALHAWIGDGKASLELRYRYEFVDQAGFAQDAKSSTLRTHVGFQSGTYRNISGFVQIEDVSPIGHEKFNSSINGRTQYPLVADPDATEVNQAYLTYSGIDNSIIHAGRRSFGLDNERFIGFANWRQNAHSYDGVTFENWALPDLNLFYGYMTKVNRIQSDKHPMGDYDGNMHLFNARYNASSLGVVTAYAYLLDIYNLPWLSTNTYGASVDGELWLSDEISVPYRFEAAKQTDGDHNTNAFDTHYALASIGLAGEYWSVTAGYERLGSDNGQGIMAKLGTYHHFNGWADMFITTPAAGLEDKYLWLDYELPYTDTWFDGTVAMLRYHKFDSIHGSMDYGQEFDADISKFWVDDQYEIGLRYAFYDAQDFATDTHKAILTLRYSYH